jgi:hypothetical protein
MKRVVVITVLVAVGLVGRSQPLASAPASSQAPVPSINTRCHSSGGRPDPSCTPGAEDPRVAQANIGITICMRGYTATVRPPELPQPRGVMLHWYANILERMCARDIVVLDRFAPEVLREGAAKLKIAEEGMTATVYQLGYSRVRERMVGFAYRSTADFASEELEVPSVGIKPHESLEPGQATHSARRRG